MRGYAALFNNSCRASHRRPVPAGLLTVCNRHPATNLDCRLLLLFSGGVPCDTCWSCGGKARRTGLQGRRTQGTAAAAANLEHPSRCWCRRTRITLRQS